MNKAHAACARRNLLLVSGNLIDRPGLYCKEKITLLAIADAG
jgi:hypothetical protein